MLNDRDFERFPKQPVDRKMFILKMLLTSLLELDLLNIEKEIAKYNNDELSRLSSSSINEVKQLISLIEYNEKF